MGEEKRSPVRSLPASDLAWFMRKSSFFHLLPYASLSVLLDLKPELLAAGTVRREMERNTVKTPVCAHSSETACLRGGAKTLYRLPPQSEARQRQIDVIFPNALQAFHHIITEVIHILHTLPQIRRNQTSWTISVTRKKWKK